MTDAAKSAADAEELSAKIRVGWLRPDAPPRAEKAVPRHEAQFEAWLSTKGWDKARKDDYRVKFARYCGRPCTAEQLDDATAALTASGAPLPQA